MENTAVSDMPVAGYRLPDDFAKKTSLGEVGSPEFLRTAEKFMGTVIEFLKRQKEKYEAIREDREIQFTERHKVNERRARLVLLQRHDATGRLDELYEDGHLKAGVYMGLTCEANKMAGALLYKGLIEQYDRPCKIRGKGVFSENDTLVRMGEAIVDDMLSRSEFASLSRHMTSLIPRWGTVALRYEMGQMADFARVDDVDGAETFQECNIRFAPNIQIWPIKDVLVSHPKRPEVRDQEGVFWLSSGKTIYDLEPDEVVMVEDSGRFAGKWRNLQQVRDAEAKGFGGDIFGYDYSSASFAPQYDLVEYDGRLPISKWVRDGVATYPILRFFGVNVGPDPGPDPARITTWANRLSHIPVWNVAYIKGSSGNNNSNEILLRFQPAPGRIPRSSLYRFPFSEDGLNFYAHSVNDLGRQMEDAADTLTNANLWTTYFNAHPAKSIDESATVNGDIDEVEEALQTPNAVVKIRPNTPVDSVVKFFQLPVVQEYAANLSIITARYEALTGITGAIKGMAAASTLGQDQMNLSQSTILFNQTVLQCAQVLATLMRQIIADTHYYMTLPSVTPDGQPVLDRNKVFVDYVSRVSGLTPSEIERAEISKDGLENDLIVVHPAMAGADNSVKVQFLIQLWTVTGGMGFSDPMAFVKVCLTLQGIRDADEITKRNTGIEPGDEERIMSQGRWIPPKPDEDFIAHLQQHQATMAGMALANPNDADQQMLAESLPMHIQETMKLLQAAVQLQQLQMSMNPQQQQAPGTPGQAGSKKGPNAPHTKEAVQSDVQGKSNPQPPSAPSMIPGAV